jgi:hypothetical protein
VRRRGVLVALWTALALTPLACSGGDGDEPSAATATTVAATSTEAAVPTSTEAPEPAPTPTEAEPVETAPPAVVAGVARKTAEQGSARVATTVGVTRPGDVEQTLEGEGAFDFERRAGELTLRLDATGSPFSEATVVFVDSTIFYRLPAGALPGGKRWLRLDPQSVADAASLDFGPLLLGNQADPMQSLLWLEALGPEMTEIGEEEVRGAATTHYRAVVDMRRLREQAPSGEEAEWGAYVDTLRERLGVEAIPVGIWVDGDGLIRRLRHELAFTAEGTSTAVTTELFDFGVAVEAQAPSPGQVAAVGDLIRP